MAMSAAVLISFASLSNSAMANQTLVEQLNFPSPHTTQNSFSFSQPLNQFDPSLGTLTSISFDVSGNIQISSSSPGLGPQQSALTGATL
jgi:hypothetical protein